MRNGSGKMRKTILTGAAVLLALGGCSKKPETTAAAGGAPSASAPTPAAATPPALPTRKDGLWKQTMSSERMNQATTICIDQTVEQKMQWWAQQAQSGGSDCTETKITPHAGGGWEFSSSCTYPNAGHIASHGVASGDFGSHYTVDIDSTTTGSPMPSANGAHKMKIDAVWQGPCPAGMKPGDLSLPGGMKINVLDVASGHAPTPGHMSQADMEKMRAQAMAMAKSMRKQGGE